MFDKTGGIAEEANVASGVLSTPIGKGRLHRSASNTFGSFDERGSIVGLIRVVGQTRVVWVSRFLRDLGLFRYAVRLIISWEARMSRVTGSSWSTNLRRHAVGFIICREARMSGIARSPGLINL